MDENEQVSQQNPEMEIDLLQLALDFFRMAKRRWWLFPVLFALCLASVSGYYYLRYDPLYRCEATFTVSTGENMGFYYSANAADQMSKTFPYLLDSGYFRSVLTDRLGTDSLNGTITAQTIENSNMVTMVVSSPSPEDARAILETALEIYPEVSRFVLGDIELNLIDELQTPEAPYNVPSWKRILLLGGGGGLCLAAALVLLMAFLNNTVKTTEDMERFSSLECLGALPEVRQKARKNSTASQYVSVLDPRTPHGFRESINSLVLRLRSVMGETGGKVLLVTSSSAGEGKSTVSINVAEQLAREGKQVMLIDLDLRSQRDGKLLGTRGGHTVAEVLRDEGLRQVNFIRFSKRLGIYFWGGETREQNPIALLKDPKLQEMLLRLKPQVDYIILDTPPCALYQDAAILADYADASLLVVRHDTVTVSHVTEALSMLEGGKASVLGYVFNAFPQTPGSYGYGYGRYGYGRYGYGRYGYGRYGYSQYGYGEKPEEPNSGQPA